MRKIFSAAVAAFILGTSGTAYAAQTINLTVVSGYSPTAAWVNVFQSYFIPEAEKRLLAAGGKYKINWNQAWGGSIAKPRGEFEAVESGLADIGIVQTVFHPDKVPMYNIAYATPFMSTDIDLITRTVNRLVKQFPEMENVWGKYNNVFLTSLAAVNNYQLMLQKPIAKPTDLAGRKICGAGLNLRYIEGVGGTGVPSTLADWYNNVRTGICEGIVVWPEAAANFKLYEVAPYYVAVNFGGANSMALTANAATWQKLPAEVRSVLSEVAEGYREALARKSMADAEKSETLYMEKGGQLVKITNEDRVAWAASLPDLATEWAESLEKQGVPGMKILNEYVRVIKEAGQPIARDWARH